MSELVCPHCRGIVPRGASVCRGCQAEIVYGEWPKYLNGMLFIVCIVLAATVGQIAAKIVPSNLYSIVWIVVIGIFSGSYFASFRAIHPRFRDRVKFKRIYRTN